MSNESKGKVFLSRTYPHADAALKKPGAAGKLNDHLNSVISSDRVMRVLEKTFPGDVVYIGQEPGSPDLSPIFAALNLSADDIKKAIKDTGVVQSSWQHANKPHLWALMTAIRFYTINKQEDRAKMAVLFMATCMYAGLVIRYFRRFYQPNAMAYAMNTLTDKFTLKQEGTMLKAILAIAWRSHQKYAADLVEGSDLNMLKYLVSMWGRLNGMVKALKNHYEQTKAQGHYLNQSKDFHDDGTAVERETDGGRVQTVTDRVSEAFFGEPMPPRIVEIAAQMADIPKQSMVLAVNEIRAGDITGVREIIHLITELFFEEEKAVQDDIRTRNFLAFAHAIYTRSNTVDGRVEKIKEILNKLLADHSPQYLRTNREATKGAFRKAMYLVIILFMQTKA